MVSSSAVVAAVRPSDLRAPFPWFGGKSRVADLIWSALGDPDLYIEPFAGSLAVLLARPHEPRFEIVNDADCMISNFWRAVQHDPLGAARWCDWPVNEVDLHARHAWLRNWALANRERVCSDPNYFDPQAAGWWVWGISCWIGGRWCDTSSNQAYRIPQIAGNWRGVHALGAEPYRDFQALQRRLRRVRVACGDWSRVVTEAVLRSVAGPVGILLDPPYGEGEAGYPGGEDPAIAATVRDWAVEHGRDRRLRIALCGYDGAIEPPPGWQEISWVATGGWARSENQNRFRERIWFSPGCSTAPQQLRLVV